MTEAQIKEMAENWKAKNGAISIESAREGARFARELLSRVERQGSFDKEDSEKIVEIFETMTMAEWIIDNYDEYLKL